jgi:hypothetical protein
LSGSCTLFAERGKAAASLSEKAGGFGELNKNPHIPDFRHF